MSKSAHAYRRDLGATRKGAFHTRKPAGTKVAKLVEKVRGMPKEDRGTVVFHGGPLTRLNQSRPGRQKVF